MDDHSRMNRYEQEIEWHSTRAMLLEVHDNVVDIIQLYAVVLLGLLERFDKAAQLQRDVLKPLLIGDYEQALSALQDFVLTDAIMFKLFPQLVDRAEPGLVVSNDLAEEYELW